MKEEEEEKKQQTNAINKSVVFTLCKRMNKTTNKRISPVYREYEKLVQPILGMVKQSTTRSFTQQLHLN